MATKLTEAAIAKNLAGLADWELRGNEIAREYRFSSFNAAMVFVNRVADLAESMDHHPDILISYKRVTLTYSTHSEGGLTGKDFAGAAMADRLVQTR